MIPNSCWGKPSAWNHFATATLVLALAMPAAVPLAANAQAATNGSVAGKIVDEHGAPINSAQVFVDRTTIGTLSRGDGTYVLDNVPAGSHIVRVRLIGFRPDSATVSVSAGQRAAQDFTLKQDPLQLQSVVVTGTATPTVNLKSSVSVTSMSPEQIQQASPRSTTEMLRYVPGFTRVESSGGEVNENISMRGILGVEYVMFMEDGLPVFPTMHTFFMNADNLFRPDENIERMEVVRGGSSALFGSNTPGAIINFINKTGGDQLQGSMVATGGTEGLARYDVDLNGPLSDQWRFNVGGFYRYDHGVRDPGFPGIRGGQFKANVTRLLDNGYIRFSAKVIDDKNQFILDLPFQNNGDPHFVPGFGTYGSMNTNEGLDLSVPTPTGTQEFPLGNGIATNASWFTADAAFDMANNWHLRNSAQIMRDHEEWNAIVPSNAMTVQDFVTMPKGQGGLGLPEGSTIQLTYTNHFDSFGNPLPFNTPNDLVAPGQDIHVAKPIAAFQDQLQLRKEFGKNTVSFGAYFANYSQDNHWYFSQILTDVRDNPRFLDAVVTTPGGSPTPITKNGFMNFMSGYTNGTGQTSIFSGVIGASLQLTDKLRADLGGRVEYDDYVQSSENTSSFDLDGDSATTVDNETFGNNSFRHFQRGITDWAASLGLNYALTDNLSLYGSAARGYKMPALDEFLQASAQQQVDLFKSKAVQSYELGVKGVTGPLGFTVDGFYTVLKNVVNQGLVIDSITGASTWVIQPQPQNKSYGAEVELLASPIEGLQLLGSGTLLRAELGSGAGAQIGARLNGVPASLGNISASYTFAGRVHALADWHWVGSRFVDITTGIALPAYSYFNFGLSYLFPANGVTLDVRLLNAFQGEGLEEGNPRLLTSGTNPLFLARPILPRRLTVALRYDFGAGGASTESETPASATSPSQSRSQQ